MEEKGEMLTGLTVKKANRSQWLEEREISRRLGPGNSCKPNKKIIAAFRAVSYLMALEVRPPPPPGLTANFKPKNQQK